MRSTLANVRDRSEGKNEHEEETEETADAAEAAGFVLRNDGEEMSMIRKLLDASFAQAVDARTYDVTLSSGAADREHDRIPPAGWKIPQSMFPVLWAHDHSALPIGRVRDVRVIGDLLRGVIEFPPENTYAFADVVVRLISTGFIRSVSVGFRPIDSPQRNELGGMDFVGAKELLELSICNVPANIDAHLDGKQTAAMQKWLGGDADVITLDDEPSVGKSSARVLKAGARHSAADMAMLDGIHAAVRDLGSKCPPDAGGVDEIDITGIDADEEQIDVAPREVAAAVAAAIRASVADVVGRATAKAIARAKGRVVFDDPFADPAARTHHIGGEDRVEFSRSDVTAVLRGVLVEAIGDRRTLAATIHRETERTLNRLRGRVD